MSDDKLLIQHGGDPIGHIDLETEMTPVSTNKLIPFALTPPLGEKTDYSAEIIANIERREDIMGTIYASVVKHFEPIFSIDTATSIAADFAGVRLRTRLMDPQNKVTMFCLFEEFVGDHMGNNRVHTATEVLCEFLSVLHPNIVNALINGIVFVRIAEHIAKLCCVDTIYDGTKSILREKYDSIREFIYGMIILASQGDYLSAILHLRECRGVMKGVDILHLTQLFTAAQSLRDEYPSGDISIVFGGWKGHLIMYHIQTNKSPLEGFAAYNTGGGSEVHDVDDKMLCTQRWIVPSAHAQNTSAGGDDMERAKDAYFTIMMLPSIADELHSKKISSFVYLENGHFGSQRVVNIDTTYRAKLGSKNIKIKDRFVYSEPQTVGSCTFHSLIHLLFSLSISSSSTASVLEHKLARFVDTYEEMMTFRASLLEETISRRHTVTPDILAMIPLLKHKHGIHFDISPIDYIPMHHRTIHLADAYESQISKYQPLEIDTSTLVGAISGMKGPLKNFPWRIMFHDTVCNIIWQKDDSFFRLSAGDFVNMVRTMGSVLIFYRLVNTASWDGLIMQIVCIKLAMILFRALDVSGLEDEYLDSEFRHDGKHPSEWINIFPYVPANKFTLFQAYFTGWMSPNPNTMNLDVFTQFKKVRTEGDFLDGGFISKYMAVPKTIAAFKFRGGRIAHGSHEITDVTIKNALRKLCSDDGFCRVVFSLRTMITQNFTFIGDKLRGQIKNADSWLVQLDQNQMWMFTNLNTNPTPHVYAAHFENFVCGRVKSKCVVQAQTSYDFEQVPISILNSMRNDEVWDKLVNNVCSATTALTVETFIVVAWFVIHMGMLDKYMDQIAAQCRNLLPQVHDNVLVPLLRLIHLTIHKADPIYLGFQGQPKHLGSFILYYQQYQKAKTEIGIIREGETPIDAFPQHLIDKARKCTYRGFDTEELLNGESGYKIISVSQYFFSVLKDGRHTVFGYYDDVILRDESDRPGIHLPPIEWKYMTGTSVLGKMGYQNDTIGKRVTLGEFGDVMVDTFDPEEPTARPLVVERVINGHKVMLRDYPKILLPWASVRNCYVLEDRRLLFIPSTFSFNPIPNSIFLGGYDFKDLGENFSPSIIDMTSFIVEMGKYGLTLNTTDTRKLVYAYINVSCSSEISYIGWTLYEQTRRLLDIQKSHSFADRGFTDYLLKILSRFVVKSPYQRFLTSDHVNIEDEVPEKLNRETELYSMMTNFNTPGIVVPAERLIHNYDLLFHVLSPLLDQVEPERGGRVSPVCRAAGLDDRDVDFTRDMVDDFMSRHEKYQLVPATIADYAAIRTEILVAVEGFGGLQQYRDAILIEIHKRIAMDYPSYRSTIDMYSQQLELCREIMMVDIAIGLMKSLDNPASLIEVNRRMSPDVVHYGEKDSMVQLFELMFGYCIRRDQYQFLRNILAENVDRRSVCELLMGRGKTSVIVPLLAFYASSLFATDRDDNLGYIHERDNSRGCIVVVPNHMVRQTTEVLVRTLIPLGIGITYDLNEIEENNYPIVICSGTEYQRLIMDQVNKEKEVFISDRMVIIDEFDMQYQPNTSEVNLTVGDNMSLPNRRILFKFIPRMTYWVHREVDLANNTLPSLEAGRIFDAFMVNDTAIMEGEDEWNAVRIEYNRHDAAATRRFLTANRHLIPIWGLITICRFHTQQALRMVINKDYGPSFVTPMAVPYAGVMRPNEGSRFSNPYLSVILTSISYVVNGITPRTILSFLRMIHPFMARIPDSMGNRTDALNLLNPLRRYFPNEVVIKGDENEWTELFERIKENAGFVLTFLNQVVLGEASHYTDRQLNSSFMDILAFTKSKFGFSGSTYINLPLYPVEIEQYRMNNVSKDITSRSDVYGAILGLINCTNLIHRGEWNLETIVEVVITNELNVLIDPGAYLKNFESVEVINKFREDGRMNTVEHWVFIDNTDSIKVMNNTGDVRDYEGEKFDSGSVFIYYDQKHIVGIDIKQDAGLIGLLLINVFNRLTDTSQAAFRLRQLNDTHQLVFGLPSSLASITNPNQLRRYLIEKEEAYMEGSDRNRLLQNIRMLRRKQEGGTVKEVWIKKPYVEKVTHIRHLDLKELLVNTIQGDLCQAAVDMRVFPTDMTQPQLLSHLCDTVRDVVRRVEADNVEVEQEEEQQKESEKESEIDATDEVLTGPSGAKHLPQRIGMFLGDTRERSGLVLRHIRFTDEKYFPHYKFLASFNIHPTYNVYESVHFWNGSKAITEAFVEIIKLSARRGVRDFINKPQPATLSTVFYYLVCIDNRTWFVISWKELSAFINCIDKLPTKFTHSDHMIDIYNQQGYNIKTGKRTVDDKVMMLCRLMFYPHRTTLDYVWLLKNLTERELRQLFALGDTRMIQGHGGQLINPKIRDFARAIDFDIRNVDERTDMTWLDSDQEAMIVIRRLLMDAPRRAEAVRRPAARAVVGPTTAVERPTATDKTLSRRPYPANIGSRFDEATQRMRTIRGTTHDSTTSRYRGSRTGRRAKSRVPKDPAESPPADPSRQAYPRSVLDSRRRAAAESIW